MAKENSIVILFAKLVSIISSPPLIAIPFTYSVVYIFSESVNYSLYWTFVSSLFVLVVCLFVFYGVRKGYYSNFDISNREQRGSVYAFATIVTALYMALIILFGGPKVLLYSLFGLLIGVLIASLINTKIKASIHLAVYSSFALVVGFFYGGPFLILWALAPVVAWSRIILKRHKPLETVVGAGLGVFIVIALYLVVKYILIT